MKRLLSVVLLLVALFVSINVLGQDKPPLVVQIERAFAQKEPGWKINHRHEQKFPPVIHLESGRNHALIWIFITDSIKTASEAYEGNVIAFGNIMGTRAAKHKLPGFGDEAVMWTPSGAAGPTDIHFRKGRIFIQVSAPSEVLARRFAQHVIEQIPAS